MILFCVLGVALACWPSVHLLVRYYRKAEQKPRPLETAGIVVATAGMAGLLAWLMATGLLF